MGGICDHISFNSEADGKAKYTGSAIDRRTVLRLMERFEKSGDYVLRKNISVRF